MYTEALSLQEDINYALYDCQLEEILPVPNEQYSMAFGTWLVKVKITGTMATIW